MDRAVWVAQYASSVRAAVATSSMDIAMAARLAATMKDSGSSSSVCIGWREVASAKKFVLPGEWMMLNFHMLILCLMWKRWTLATWSSDFSSSREITDQWLVVCGYSELVTSLGKELGLFQGLTFDGCVPELGS